jgi:hypothetical protein
MESEFEDKVRDEGVSRLIWKKAIQAFLRRDWKDVQ